MTSFAFMFRFYVGIERWLRCSLVITLWARKLDSKMISVFVALNMLFSRVFFAAYVTIIFFPTVYQTVPLQIEGISCPRTSSTICPFFCLCVDSLITLFHIWSIGSPEVTLVALNLTGIVSYNNMLFQPAFCCKCLITILTLEKVLLFVSVSRVCIQTWFMTGLEWTNITHKLLLLFMNLQVGAKSILVSKPFVAYRARKGLFPCVRS